MKIKLLLVTLLCSVNSLLSQTVNELLTETFGSGPDVPVSGINPNYCFQDQALVDIHCQDIDPLSPQGGRPTQPPYIRPTSPSFVDDNEHSVTNRILYPFTPYWANPGVVKDHTSTTSTTGTVHPNNGTNPQGRFFLVNIGSGASSTALNPPNTGTLDVLYSKPIVDIIPNQDITITFWAQNIITSDPIATSLADPIIEVVLVKDYDLPTATVLPATSNTTGFIPKNDSWNKYTLTLNPGNNTQVTFALRSFSRLYGRNDVAIDDISVTQSSVLSTKESTLEKAALYPNPVKGELHIENVVLEKATVYDFLGKLVKEVTFKEGQSNNIISLEGLQKGIYCIYLEGEGAKTAKKIVVE